MQPAFAIIANQQNITSLIKDRLLSLQITDQAGIKSDMLTLTLDDRNHHIALPNHGAELECYIGCQTLNYMGLFVVDEVEIASPPATLTIRAHAADMRASLKSSRNQSYTGITLGDLLHTIAKRHSLNPKITGDLATTHYDHINQIKESDINLLTRLTKELDAITTVKAGNLMIAPKAKGKTISGETLPTTQLKQDDLTSWRVTIADRQAYQSVIASYYDHDEAQTINVLVGVGEPQYSIKKTYKDENTALAAAKAKYQEFARGTRKLSLTLPYQSGLMAETPINLTHIREGINGDWIIEEATHELSNQGLTTRINATLKE